MIPRRRKTSPRVLGGKVQRKNNWELTTHWSQTEIDGLVYARERPGTGYRHYVRKQELERFLRLLPDWDELATGLDAVLLAGGSEAAQGWYVPGIVAVCAWSKNLEEDWSAGWVEDHGPILDRIDVERTAVDEDTIRLCFTAASVKAFQLMHVLLHELGHHHDRMTTKSKHGTARGEGFAEAYSLRYADRLWDAYHREFPW